MKPFLISLTLIVTSFYSFAQDEYRDRIVFNSKDTIKCKILVVGGIGVDLDFKYKDVNGKTQKILNKKGQEVWAYEWNGWHSKYNWDTTDYWRLGQSGKVTIYFATGYNGSHSYYGFAKDGPSGSILIESFKNEWLPYLEKCTGFKENYKGRKAYYNIVNMANVYNEFCTQ